MMAKTIENVEIVVDDRERPSGVIEELEKAPAVVVKIEHLSVGDCCVDGAVLIERKTASDFAQSLILSCGPLRKEVKVPHGIKDLGRELSWERTPPDDEESKFSTKFVARQ